MSNRRMVPYVINTKNALPVQFGGATYKIPAKETSIPDLAKKLDVSEDLALKIAKHAASKYAAVRPPTKAKERSQPPQKWLWLEDREVVVPAPPPPVLRPKPPVRDRLAMFQELDTFN